MDAFGFDGSGDLVVYYQHTGGRRMRPLGKQPLRDQTAGDDEQRRSRSTRTSEMRTTELLRRMCQRPETRSKLLNTISCSLICLVLGLGHIWFGYRTVLTIALMWGPWSAGSCTFTAPLELAAPNAWHPWEVSAPVLVHSKHGATWNTTANTVSVAYVGQHVMGQPAVRLEDIYKWWESEVGFTATVSKDRLHLEKTRCQHLTPIGGSHWCHRLEAPHNDDTRATVPCW